MLENTYITSWLYNSEGLRVTATTAVGSVTLWVSTTATAAAAAVQQLYF